MAAVVRRVRAVEQVDLTIHAGELLGIMGASGSGKSTLLHLLAGLIRPDAGRVLCGKAHLEQMSDNALTAWRRREVALVFQQYNLLPTMTAVENVALPLLLDGVGRSLARESACRCLETVGLSSRPKHRPAQLSGGEQQRVAIARALATNPRLLLADEPTGNLDRVNATGICHLLRQLAASDERAVVMVTHDPTIAMHADRVVVLGDGRVIDEFSCDLLDGVEELGQRYLQSTMHALLDAPT